MVVELFTSKTFEEVLGHLGPYVSLGVAGREFSYKILLDGQGD